MPTPNLIASVDYERPFTPAAALLLRRRPPNLIASVDYKRPAKRSSTQNNLWQRTYHLEFLVETVDDAVGSRAVRLAADPLTGFYVPSVGNSYSFMAGTPYAEADTGSFAQSVTATEDDDGGGRQWTVAVDYGAYDVSGSQPADPTQWAIKVTHEAQSYERVVAFDQDGVAIRNSAGDPFGDPVTVDDSRSVLAVERNELVSAFDLTLSEQMRDKVNAAEWNGFAARTVKSRPVTTSQPQYDATNNVFFYAVKYVFEVNRDTWTRKLLDQGFAAVDPTDGKLKAVTEGGQPVSEAVPLDGSGHRLPPGGTPVALSFEVYPAADFGVFNLDLSTRLGA